MDDIVQKVLDGNVRAVARLISMVENRRPEARQIVSKLYKHSGKAYVIGITGPPGVGKSSLILEIALKFRTNGFTLGILAVDPTSPFSGGALLGDRTRMQNLSTDKGVFIRSMGSRGSLGGLAMAVPDAIHILDAMGKEVILLETVGSGQSEVDVMNFAHTVLLVTMPRAGDQIQALKAGIMEIADIFSVNKSDLDGADLEALELETMLQMKEDIHTREWVPPVIKTSVKTAEGIQELYEALLRHKDYMASSGLLEKKQRKRREKAFFDYLEFRINNLIRERLRKGPGYRGLMEAILDGRLDPGSAVDRVASEVCLGPHA
ncbi:MAG: methylmalonyl Co-A mutase-associated GTPase MeaB [Thermodesulfobacteriota bacterium]